MNYLPNKELTAELKEALVSSGAELVGFADLSGLDEDVRFGFPRGIIIGMTWDKDVLRGIANGPTHPYHDNYDRLNDRLDEACIFAEEWLKKKGFDARAQTRKNVGPYEPDLLTTLPHKTVATRAGVGWIGKCALLVTREFGPALRISSILTDAPLECGSPIDESGCGDCAVCTTICPGKAVSGKSWSAGMPREEFWDAKACKQTALNRSRESLGTEMTLCGLCILKCPWTQKFLNA